MLWCRGTRGKILLLVYFLKPCAPTRSISMRLYCLVTLASVFPVYLFISVFVFLSSFVLSFRSFLFSLSSIYRLDDRGSRVRFPAGAGNFSLHHRVQNDSGAHPASYPMGTGALSLGVKWPGRESDNSPPSSAEVKECMELYLHSQYAFMTWCSVKAQGQLYLFLLVFHLLSF
jgi:hypothetical protein